MMTATPRVINFNSPSTTQHQDYDDDDPDNVDENCQDSGALGLGDLTSGATDVKKSSVPDEVTGTSQKLHYLTSAVGNNALSRGGVWSRYGAEVELLHHAEVKDYKPSQAMKGGVDHLSISVLPIVALSSYYLVMFVLCI